MKYKLYPWRNITQYWLMTTVGAHLEYTAQMRERNATTNC